MTKLKELAQIIRNENRKEANTAIRIGDMFISIIDEMEKLVPQSSITQETGDSQTLIMSQNAVIQAIASAIKGIPTDISVYVTSLDITSVIGEGTAEQVAEIKKILNEYNKGHVVIHKKINQAYDEILIYTVLAQGGADNRTYFISALSSEGYICRASIYAAEGVWDDPEYGEWTTSLITLKPVIPDDAPSDNSTYGRNNKKWVKVPGKIVGENGELYNAAKIAGQNAHAEGDLTQASGYAAHAQGHKTIASGYASHAEGGSTDPGEQTTAAGKFAHAEGNRTHAAKDASHAEGYATRANGTCSHAEGNKTTATGEDSHAEGNTTNAVGLYSHAEGQNTTAKGQAAHAEGNNTKTGECSTFDSNYETISTSGNNYGHAEGNNTSAGGQAAHAEGEGGNAFGRASHAEGQSGAAIGLAAHSEGELTMACGEGSHSEGIYTQAGKAIKNGDEVTISGSAAHAEGHTTKALGDNSHAEGKNTIANNESEHAQGRYNVSHTHASDPSQQTIDSVGIGTKESDRKNASETMANGDLYIYGIGGYNGKNPSEAQTLQQVAANIPIILDDFYEIVRQLTGGSNVIKGSYTAPTVKPSELFNKIVFGRLKDSEGVYGAAPLTVRKDYGDRGDFYWFSFFLEGIYGVFAINVDADDTWGDILTSNFKQKNIFE